MKVHESTTLADDVAALDRAVETILDAQKNLNDTAEAVDSLRTQGATATERAALLAHGFTTLHSAEINRLELGVRILAHGLKNLEERVAALETR